MPSSLNSTIDTKIQVRLRVSPDGAQARLPAPWHLAPTVTGPHAGTNLLVIFTDVLLRQDAGGAPAPDAVNRYVAFLVPAVHSQTGEKVQFMARVLAAHPASIPGRFGNAAAAAVLREHTLAGTDLETVCTELFELRTGSQGCVELRLRYRRGVPERITWPTNLRSTSDPALARSYRSEALVDIVRSIPAGINRVEAYSLRVTVPGLTTSFDGTERLVSITAVPWFTRQEFALPDPIAS